MTGPAYSAAPEDWAHANACAILARDLLAQLLDDYIAEQEPYYPDLRARDWEAVLDQARHITRRPKPEHLTSAYRLITGDPEATP